MQIHINSYGARLRVKNGLFSVKYAIDGVVHEKRYAPTQITHLFMKNSTSVSVDALLLAIEYDVHFVLTDRFGFPAGRVYGNEPNSTTAILKAQALVSCHPATALEYNRAWMLDKLSQQSSMMQKTLKRRSKSQQKRFMPKLEQHRQISGKLLFILRAIV